MEREQLGAVQMAAIHADLAAKQLRDDGRHCHHFLRHLPAVTLPCQLFSPALQRHRWTGPALSQNAIDRDGHLRGSPCFFCARSADALLHAKPRAPLLCSGSTVFKYVGPASPSLPSLLSLLSFPSSCSRLSDNGGKSVLKRQLNSAQSAL